MNVIVKVKKFSKLSNKEEVEVFTEYTTYKNAKFSIKQVEDVNAYNNTHHKFIIITYPETHQLISRYVVQFLRDQQDSVGLHEKAFNSLDVAMQRYNEHIKNGNKFADIKWQDNGLFFVLEEPGKRLIEIDGYDIRIATNYHEKVTLGHCFLNCLRDSTQHYQNDILAVFKGTSPIAIMELKPDSRSSLFGMGSSYDIPEEVYDLIIKNYDGIINRIFDLKKAQFDHRMVYNPTAELKKFTNKYKPEPIRITTAMMQSNISTDPDDVLILNAEPFTFQSED